MPTVTDVKFGNGEIRFFGKVDPVPATSQTTGDVTIHNAAQPGIDSHYRTTFMLTVDIEEGDLSITNVFHWNSIVPSDDQHAPYRSIEDQAARQIAPMLRSVADELDKHIAEFEGREAAKSGKA